MPPPNISLPHCWANTPPHSQTNTYIYRYISPLYQNFPQLYLYICMHLSVKFNLTNKLNNHLDLLMPPPPHNLFLPCTKLPYLKIYLFNFLIQIYLRKSHFSSLIKKPIIPKPKLYYTPLTIPTLSFPPTSLILFFSYSLQLS